MNKSSSFLLLSAMCVIAFQFLSCEKDESFPTSGIKGLPTKVTNDSQTLYLTYTGNLLNGLQWSTGSTLKFSYASHTLNGLVTSPQEGMADGYGTTSFEQKGTTIQIASSGEPSLDMTRRLNMDLDANGIPVRITDLGYFQHTGHIETQKYPGEGYALFTSCPETGSLLKMEIYSRADSTLIETSAYAYDSQQGLTGKIDLPSWFPYYWEYTHRYSNDIRDHLFLSHTHNIIQIMRTESRSSAEKDFLFTYSYENDGYPRLVEQTDERIEIHY